LEKLFFLDDEDRALVGRRRGDHMKLGFALQLVTVRYVGRFLEDPLDVAGVVLDFVAGQLEIDDPSRVKRYTERAKTRFDHAWEIQWVYALKDFDDVEGELRVWVAARSWTSGDGPKAIFSDAVAWLRELWKTLESLLTVRQRYVLDQLVDVVPGARVSDLERWRKGPAPRGSGPAVIKSLEQVRETWV